MSDVAQAWGEMVFAVQCLFLKPGDFFDNGSLPRRWLRYFVCRKIGHRKFEAYTSGAGFACEQCANCGLRLVVKA